MCNCAQVLDGRYQEEEKGTRGGNKMHLVLSISPCCMYVNVCYWEMGTNRYRLTTHAWSYDDNTYNVHSESCHFIHFNHTRTIWIYICIILFVHSWMQRQVSQSLDNIVLLTKCCRCQAVSWLLQRERGSIWISLTPYWRPRCCWEGEGRGSMNVCTFVQHFSITI